MPENHKKTILLLEQKLDEALVEEQLCNHKIENFVRDMKSAKEKRDEIAEVIKYLKDSIIVLRSLDKSKPAAKKPKSKKEA